MRTFIAILLLFLCTPVLADDAADRMKLAQRLADLHELRALYSKAEASCHQADADIEKGLVELYASRSVEFGRISPQSAYWPEARAIYRDYVDSRCAITSAERLEPLFVKAYATSMSAAQLRAAIDFQRSPAGRAQQAATRKIFQDTTEFAYRMESQDQQAASLIFRQSMLLLKNKYKAAPK